MLNWTDIVSFSKGQNPTVDKKVIKTNAQWKEILTATQFKITRQSGTEMPNSSSMCSAIDPGIYSCVCCKTVLFDATEKFDSGTGWPSFTQPVKRNLVSYFEDLSTGNQRIEIQCNTCDAHLGHVFPDGPKPSGLRFCVNAVALVKVS